MDAPRVPLFDIRLGDEEVAAVEEVLRSGWLTMGPRTKRFEDAFARQLGAGHAIALANGTAALHLAYLAAGVGAGDEVIVPAITFVATASAARYCGAEAVAADVYGPHDLSIDPEDVERRIGPRTKAVCVVHYAGYAGPVAELRALCAERGIALIEDAAHAPSAAPAGTAEKLGTYGLAAAFSFFSNKVLGCGEGGLVATDDEDVAAFVRSRRSHALTSGTWDRHRGHADRYDVVGVGFNYRIDELRAALLSARLGRLEEDIAARRRLVHRYREALSDVEGLVIPYQAGQVDASSCYVMPLLVEDPSLRDPLRDRLLQRYGVQTSVLYPALHELAAYAELARGPLPRSERVARSEVTVPLYPHLPEADQDLVVTAVRESLAELSAARGARLSA